MKIIMFNKSHPKALILNRHDHDTIIVEIGKPL